MITEHSGRVRGPPASPPPNEILVDQKDPLHREFAAAIRHDPKVAQDMKERKTHAEKKAYKKEWSKLKAVETEEELSYERSLILEEISIGEMMPLKRIAWELGDDIEAAMNWARSCVERGPNEFEANDR